MRPYAALTFLSAFLLFLVQPLTARAVLPWFGGAASVWTTSLLFYQTLLFVGYLYAHLSSGLGVRRQALLHVGLVLGAVLFLPIIPAEAWKPTEPGAPTLRLLGLLAATVGAPYVLLAGTTPLLHDWFARRHPGRSPYRLYAISNAGSMVALVAYPLAVEPLMTTWRQAVGWSGLFGMFAGGMALLAWGMVGRPAARGAPSVPGWPGVPSAFGEAGTGRAPTGFQAPHGLQAANGARELGENGASRPSRADLALWLALAACGSGLLLSVTNLITMDVASVPLLWILPLIVYLGTFILAFAGLYRRGTWGALLLLSLGATGILWAGGFALPVFVQVALGCGVLGVGAMVCHGELARTAPAPAHLTTFYLAMAGGGALGGLSVAVVAPAFLSDFYEFPGFVVLAFILMILSMQRDDTSILLGRSGIWVGRMLWLVAGLAGLGLSLPSTRAFARTVEVERNFYGVLRVQDAPRGLLSDMRVMRHGRIFHGAERLAGDERARATAYFTEGSGVQRAIAAHPRRLAGETMRIGVIGLGVGTLSVWGQAGDHIRFYEINPAVGRMAREHFSFLGESPATVDVVLGDGRIALEADLQAAGGAPLYDLLVLDAFAGDAVPVHLLTREAFDLYRRSVTAGSVIVFQVTNRHVDLERVVRGLAEAAGMQASRFDQDPAEGSGGIHNSWMWVAPPGVALPAGAPPTTPTLASSVLWTDDFGNLLGVLR